MEALRNCDGDLARLALYRFLALASSDPAAERFVKLRDPALLAAATDAAAWIRESQPEGAKDLAPGELPPEDLDLSTLLARLSQPHRELLEAYDLAYGLVPSEDCPPYETSYCPQTFSIYRSHALADVAGYFRAFGVEPSRDKPERHDHISLELEFMAWLIARERSAAGTEGGGGEEQARVFRRAQLGFLRDHLVWWVPAFCFALRRKLEGISHPAQPSTDAGNYLASLARVLAAFVGAERRAFGLASPKELLLPSADDEGRQTSDCSTCGIGTP